MIRRITHWVDTAFSAVAATALAAMTLLIAADVTLRYGLGMPIFFAHDLVGLYLTPAVFFFGVGPTYARNEHLAVDILTLRLPPRLRAMSDMLAAAIGLAVFTLLVWCSWDRFWQSFLRDEVIASIVPWPAWASYLLVPAGSAAMVLVCAARLADAIRMMVTGARPAGRPGEPEARA